MNKAFKFVTDDRTGYGYKLVVYARTLKSARQYVKNEAISSLTHRRLRYVGEGAPNDVSSWTGAIADKPESPDWLRAPVTIPDDWKIDADGIIMPK